MERYSSKKGFIFTGLDLGSNQVRVGSHNSGTFFMKINTSHRGNIIDVVIISTIKKKKPYKNNSACNTFFFFYHLPVQKQSSCHMPNGWANWDTTPSVSIFKEYILHSEITTYFSLTIWGTHQKQDNLTGNRRRDRGVFIPESVISVKPGWSGN